MNAELTNEIVEETMKETTDVIFDNADKAIEEVVIESSGMDPKTKALIVLGCGVVAIAGAVGAVMYKKHKNNKSETDSKRRFTLLRGKKAAEDNYEEDFENSDEEECSEENETENE